MNNKKPIVFLPLFMLAGSAWRRWYGGGFGKLGDISRFWKYLVLVIICFIMYWITDPYFTFLKEIRTYATIAAFAYHWARSHGDYFYIWHTTPDEGRIKWIDWVLHHIFPERMYYGVLWNITGLFLRYTSTACIVALCVPNAWFICAGFLTTLAYIVTSKIGTGKTPVQCAEWLSGALNFGLLYLCIGG